MNILITESQLKLIEGRYVDFSVDPDVSLEVWEDIDRLDLDSIVIPKSLRGQGIGTKIMSMIIEYSNSVNKPIYLTPSTSFGATSIERLKRFYKKFGFEKNKNPESRHTLVRNPN